MESAGIMFVRTRGEEATMARSLIEEEYNAVGLYWEASGTSEHAFVLFDLVRGPVRLLPAPRGVSAMPSPSEESDVIYITTAMRTTIENTLFTHSEVERVSCWPFHSPDVDRVCELAYKWISELNYPKSFEEFIARPRSTLDYLPSLRKSGLTLAPSLEYPGKIVHNACSEEESEQRAGNKCKVIKYIEDGTLRVVQSDLSHTCLWCSQYREISETLAREEKIGEERTRAIFGTHLGGHLARGSIHFVRESTQQDLRALLASVRESILDKKVPVIDFGILLQIARAIGVAVEDLCAPPIGSTSAVLLLNRDMSSPDIHTPRVLHIPLCAARGDLEALDRGQLEEVFDYLSQSHMLRDPRTNSLRKLLEEELSKR